MGWADEVGRIQISRKSRISDKGLRFCLDSGPRRILLAESRGISRFQTKVRGFSAPRDKRLSVTLPRSWNLRQRAEVFVQAVYGLCLTIFRIPRGILYPRTSYSSRNTISRALGQDSGLEFLEEYDILGSSRNHIPRGIRCPGQGPDLGFLEGIGES